MQITLPQTDGTIVSAKRKASGPMRSLLHIQQQIEGDDGYGNVTVAWATVATVAAGLAPMRGSETVMAARMAGRQPYIVTIRSSEQARQIPASSRRQVNSSMLFTASTGITLSISAMRVLWARR